MWIMFGDILLNIVVGCHFVLEDDCVHFYLNNGACMQSREFNKDIEAKALFAKLQKKLLKGNDNIL